MKSLVCDGLASTIGRGKPLNLLNLNLVSLLQNPKMHGTMRMTSGTMAKPIGRARKANSATSPKGNLGASTRSLGDHQK
eukprot:9268720-Prorocentrum_lima.AAC.1